MFSHPAPGRTVETTKTTPKTQTRTRRRWWWRFRWTFRWRRRLGGWGGRKVGNGRGAVTKIQGLRNHEIRISPLQPGYLLSIGDEHHNIRRDRDYAISHDIRLSKKSGISWNVSKGFCCRLLRCLKIYPLEI